MQTEDDLGPPVKGVNLVFLWVISIVFQFPGWFFFFFFFFYKWYETSADKFILMVAVANV